MGHAFRRFGSADGESGGAGAGGADCFSPPGVPGCRLSILIPRWRPCRQPDRFRLASHNAITNEMYRDITGLDTLAASKSLQHLRDAGLLKQNGKGRATYYTATDRLARPLVATVGSEDTTRITAQPEGLIAQPEGSNSQPEGLPTAAVTESRDALPQELEVLVQDLGGKPSPEKLREAILRMCAWKPLSASELARYLKRNANYLRSTYLTPMIAEGLLSYTIPEEPAHPHQSYRVANRPTMSEK